MSTEEHLLRIHAYDAFDAVLQKAKFGSLVNRVIGHPRQLHAFQNIDLNIAQPIERGIDIIPIDDIKGSVGRAQDFDAYFRPRVQFVRERWISIEIAYQQGLALPPVEVYKICGEYFVIDGHHRISVMRSHGQEFIEAHIIELIDVCLN
jgi:hypothetical protein